MIKEINEIDNLVLNVPLLEWGTTNEQFALVSKINVKVDSLGKTFLQCILRGKDGTPVIGRIFGEDTVKKYVNEIEKYIGQVVLVSYLVDEVFGQKSLAIDWMVMPAGDDLKGIKADLFEAVIPGIEKYVESNAQLFSAHRSIFTDSFASLFKQKSYTSLYFLSNEEICSGKNGYVYVILNSCWKRLELYQSLGYVTEEELALMMSAQLICECVLSTYSELKFDYNFHVYTKVHTLLQVVQSIGTSAERKRLTELITGYINYRLNAVSTKTESKLAKVLFTEYTAVIDNLRYLTSLENYTGATATMQGKLVR